MKKWILLPLVLLLAGTVPAQCPLDNVLLDKYNRDVKDLALRRILLFNHPDKSLIEIPQVWQDTIWNGLAAIFRSNGIPERDTIFDMFCIHHASPQQTALRPDLHLLLNDPWTFDSLTRHIITGNAALDSLLLHHEVVYVSTLFANTIWVQTPQAINTQALADALLLFPEVLWAAVEYRVGDADRILYNVINGEQFFDFHLRWGDCFAGCINRRIWHFQVSAGCTTAYLGRTNQLGGGYPFPNPVNCRISTATTDGISNLPDVLVFPNPFHDNLTVRQTNTQDVTVQLFNVAGQRIRNSATSGETVWETSDLSPGVYFLVAGSSTFRKICKVVKM